MDIKPTYKLLVIVPLLAIEFKGIVAMEIELMIYIVGRNLTFSMLFNLTPPVRLSCLTVQINITGKISNNQAKHIGVRYNSCLEK